MGTLRINAQRRHEAYAAIAGLPCDAFIDGDQDRNRALETDVVVVEMLPRSTWRARTRGAHASTPAAAAAATPMDSSADEHVDDRDDAEGEEEALHAEEEQAESDIVEEDVDGTVDAEEAAHGASLEDATETEAAAALTAALQDVQIAPAASLSVAVVAAANPTVDPPLFARGGDCDAERVLALPISDAVELSRNLWQPSVTLHMTATAVPAATVDAAGMVGAARADGSVAARAAPTGRAIPAHVLAAMQSDAYSGTVAAMTALIHDGGLQPRARVVGIAHAAHPRIAVGLLRPADENASMLVPIPERQAYVRLVPLDPKLPCVVIPRHQADPAFLACPRNFQQKLFEASIDRWGHQARFPMGNLCAAIGEAGEIATETRALLAQHCINDLPFSTEVMDVLRAYESATPMHAPGGEVTPWRIPDAEYARRRDMRGTRIFTVDPWNAKDLDDALHITPLGDDVFEIGVHIADVSFFVKPGNALDTEASRRATSVYLVQRVIPMLPPLLCEQLCSLNPGVDRLAFSVIWRMRGNGELCEGDAWFGRTVIRSCAKMDYGTAQRCIDETITPAHVTDPSTLSDELWAHARRPVGHSCMDVWTDLHMMSRIAMGRRAKRFAAGALALHKVKLAFDMDASGNPIGVKSYPIRDSNRMVEEYMLLANFLVAQKLLMSVGDRAVLRCHPPIMADKTTAVLATARDIGLTFDTSTAGGIHNSLQAAYAVDPVAARVLEYLVTKPMKPAQYFAAGRQAPETWGHYALAIYCYTHFTSPIRRYADVLVHRLLAEALDEPDVYGHNAPPAVDDLAAQADICNERKIASKAAQERSDRVYLCIYLRDHACPAEAIVCDVGGPSFFTLLLTQWDLEKRVYLDRCGWSGSYDEGTCRLRIGDASTMAAGTAAGTVAPMSKRKARDMVKWARAHPVEAAALRAGTGRESDLLRAAEATDGVRPAMLHGAEDAAALDGALAHVATPPSTPPRTPAGASGTSGGRSRGGHGAAGSGGAGFPSQVHSSFVMPALGLTIQRMSRVRVWLYAITDRVPMDFEVQLMEVL